jgi:hypothetical protein
MSRIYEIVCRDWTTRAGRYAFINYRLGQRVEAGVFCDAHAKDLEAPANCTAVKVRRVRARCEMCARARQMESVR